MYVKELKEEEEKLISDVEDALLHAESKLLPETSRITYEKECKSFKK